MLETTLIAATVFLWLGAFALMFACNDKKKELNKDSKYNCNDCYCYELIKNICCENKRLYIGTEDNLIFFEDVLLTLGIRDFVDYEVLDVDGEIEVELKCL